MKQFFIALYRYHRKYFFIESNAFLFGLIGGIVGGLTVFYILLLWEVIR